MATPDPELLDAAAALMLRRPTAELLAQARALFADPGLAHDQQDAQRDFSDLFFSPASGRCRPPYEGAFREGRMGGQAHVAAAEAYRKAGFDPWSLAADPLWRARLAPDHLGVELAFASALWKNHRLAPDRGFDRLAEAFHAERLAPWVSDYARALGQAARSRLYRLTAELLRTLC